jgi:hypothetical protein
VLPSHDAATSTPRHRKLIATQRERSLLPVRASALSHTPPAAPGEFLLADVTSPREFLLETLDVQVERSYVGSRRLRTGT